MGRRSSGVGAQNIETVDGSLNVNANVDGQPTLQVTALSGQLSPALQIVDPHGNVLFSINGAGTVTNAAGGAGTGVVDPYTPPSGTFTVAGTISSGSASLDGVFTSPRNGVLIRAGQTGNSDTSFQNNAGNQTWLSVGRRIISGLLGTITNLGGLPTAGVGLGAIRASGSVLASTANGTTVATYTPGANGFYRISGMFDC